MDTERNSTFKDITEHALKHSIVRLRWENTDEDSGRVATTMGTGFFVDSNLIVTNLHCVAGASSITAEIVGAETEFTVVGVVSHDITNDLVLLGVSGEGVPIPIGNSKTVSEGDEVCVVGYPQGEKGIAKQVTIHDIQNTGKHILIRDAFEPGHSGSPLLNRAGEIIGIAVIGIGETSPMDNEVELTLNRAIPADVLKSLLENVGNLQPLSTWQDHPKIKGYTIAFEGQIFLMNQQFGEAMDCFNTALNLNADLAETYCNRAVIYLILGEARKAIADCNSAIKLNPDYVEAYINRAAANLSLELFAKVLKDCDTALNLNANSVRVYQLRAAVKHFLEKYEEAITDYDEAIRLNPYSAQSYFLRGNTKLLLRDFAGAIEDYDKSIRLNPEFANASNIHYGLGEAKHELGDYAGAIADYDKAIEQSPKDEYLHNRRGLANIKFGDTKADCEENGLAINYYTAAIDDFTQAIMLNNEFEGYRNNRAIAKHKIKTMKEQLKTVRKQ